MGEHLLDEQVKQPLISDTIDLVEPMEFDRKRLAEVLHRRLDRKGATGAAGGKQQLDIDSHAILLGAIPRKHAELPKKMGNYERIAPGEICESVMRTRAQVFNNKKDRLSANDLLPVRKILEHVVEKILKPESASQDHYSPQGGPGSNAGSGGGGNQSNQGVGGGGMTIEELNEAVDAIELLCNDVVLDLSWDLRTIKHFIWRGVSGDLTLLFKQKDSPNTNSKK